MSSPTITGVDLRPTVGMKLDGGAVGEEGERGRVGEPMWGPMGRLRDLEVRVGLMASDAPAAMRVQRWAQRMAALVGRAAATVGRAAATGSGPEGMQRAGDTGGAEEPFYARSFAVDPIGTATMVLAWRDGLVEAGWAGTNVPGGGARLATLAALEAMAEPAMPAGTVDRLAAVEVEVALMERSPYAELTFADDRRAWPHRWQRVFALLVERGSVVRRREGRWLGAVGASIEGSGEASDLQWLQALIVGDGTSRGGGVRGDGSIVLLRAATTLEAADAVAAIVGGMRESVAMVRPTEEALLDEAMTLHGMPRLGAKPSSRWRAATLVLPLALEMIFDPCDPRQVLELLGLPVSPFARVTRWQLSRALCDAPGVGGVRWQQAKERTRTQIEQWANESDDPAGGDAALRLRAHFVRPTLRTSGGEEPPNEGAAARARREIELVEEWLETERHDAQVGAPREVVVAAVTRVREWLRRRLAAGGNRIEATAFNQCEAMLVMLGEDVRPRLSWLAMRQLLDAVADGGAPAEISVEEAGRCDHVAHPAALLGTRDVVVWWQFVAGTARPPHRARWRRTELEALAACGVFPADPAAALAQESRQWRQAIMAARRRLVLVLPDTDRGEGCAAHPLWDEIVARLGLDDRAIERLTVRVADLLSVSSGDAVASVGIEVEGLAALPLPPARPMWRGPPGAIAAATRWTPDDLQQLLECPLRWVLGRAAGIGGYTVPALPVGQMLSGKLAHRLVEELVAAGTLVRADEEIAGVIDRLLPGTAARLRLPGLAIELEQLRHQLIRMVRALGEAIDRGGLVVAAVEEEVGGMWLAGELAGRLDLRLQDGARDVILDLKWGHGSYRDLLKEGRAVQLAFYAQARRLETGTTQLPLTAYFSLGRGRLLTTAGELREIAGGPHVIDGPDVGETIERIARTVPRVQEALAEGVVPVTGVRSAAPLLDALGVDAAMHDQHYPAPGLPKRERDEPAGCKYCRLGPVCGRSWEAHA